MRQCLALIILITTNALAVESHCSSQERTIFSCKVMNSSKVVSLCASQNLSTESGSLTYKFGKINRIELSHPNNSERSLEKFRYAHYVRYQVDRKQISFTIGAYNYSILDYYEGEQKPSTYRGVLVVDTRVENSEISLLCGPQAISDLTTLDGLVPCDEGNALANCKP